MGGRYWISGVQIGILCSLIDHDEDTQAKHLLEELVENQFIGNAKILRKKFKR